MSAHTRWALTAREVVLFYAVLMTATVGSYQLLLLVILAATALLFIRRRPRRAGK